MMELVQKRMEMAGNDGEEVGEGNGGGAGREGNAPDFGAYVTYAARATDPSCQKHP